VYVTTSIDSLAGVDRGAFCHPRRHLAIAFVGFQFESGVIADIKQAAIVCSATVANKRFANAKIQHDIDQRGRKQKAECEVFEIKAVSHQEASKARQNYGDSQSLRKILADEQIATWANEATAELNTPLAIVPPVGGGATQ
jgi:hypothetical protein